VALGVTISTAVKGIALGATIILWGENGHSVRKSGGTLRGALLLLLSEQWLKSQHLLLFLKRAGFGVPDTWLGCKDSCSKRMCGGVPAGVKLGTPWCFRYRRRSKVSVNITRSGRGKKSN
jgi:hypothetical protein